MTGKVYVLLFVASICGIGQAAKVKVSVYYESLCPDSIRFITTQFWPTYEQLAGSLDVNLIPYGKASESNTTGHWTFNCQHGPRECFGNAYHACAISHASIQQSTQFVYCSMNSQDPSSEILLRECAVNANIRWEILKTCYQYGEADQLLIANGHRTRAVTPRITFIPTIILNDSYSETNQMKALYDFQSLICDALNLQPEICKENIVKVIYAA